MTEIPLGIHLMLALITVSAVRIAWKVERSIELLEKLTKGAND